MKIAMLLDRHQHITDANYVAGTERVFLQDLVLLKELGHQVVAFSAKGNHDWHIVKLPLYTIFEAVIEKLPLLACFQKEILKDICFAGCFWCVSRTAQVKIVHSALAAALFGPEASLIFMHDLRKVTIPGLWSRLQSTQIIAVSNYVARAFAEKNNFPLTKIKVIPNAVDTTFFSPHSENHSKTQSKRKVQKKIKLLFCSAWVPEKGLQLLVDAINDLPSSVKKNLTLTIAGGKKLWQKQRRAYLKKILTATQDKKRFLLIEEGVAYQDMPSLYRNHDYLLMPSLWEEPFGLVVLEALACGLPVIGFASGAISEIVSHGKNGLLIQSKTSKALQRELMNIVKTDSFREVRGKSLLLNKNKIMTASSRKKQLTALISRSDKGS